MGDMAEKMQEICLQSYHDHLAVNMTSIKGNNTTHDVLKKAKRISCLEQKSRSVFGILSNVKGSGISVNLGSSRCSVMMEWLCGAMSCRFRL
jgi:hypothetical protein